MILLHVVSQQVFWIFFTTLNGGIYFQEFMEPEFIHKDVSGFIIGMMIIGLGVSLLSPNKPAQYIEEIATQANDTLQKEVFEKHKDKFKFLNHIKSMNGGGGGGGGGGDRGGGSGGGIELGGGNTMVGGRTPTRQPNANEASSKLLISGSFSPEPIDFV
jgi:uncharacterized membrane protein YgcG